MKIAVLHGPRDLRLEEQTIASELKPDEIRVKTRISALKIGTDRGNYEGAEQVPGAPDYPRWVGDSKALDLVITVDRSLNVVDAHSIADAVEAIVEETLEVSDVSVHVEPADKSEQH